MTGTINSFMTDSEYLFCVLRRKDGKMIKDVREDLEFLLDLYDQENTEENFDALMITLTRCIATGANWLVPVMAMEEGSNETDFSDGFLLKKLPGMVRRTIEREGSSPVTCAFTAPDRTKVQKEESCTVSYPARDFLEEFLESGDERMMLNPWSSSLLLSRRGVEALLSDAEKVPPEDYLQTMRYEVEPRAVLDTNVILKEWQEGWEGADCERWKLAGYPVMADGRVLLHFEMRNELHDKNGQENGQVNSISRVLEYGILEDGFVPIGKYTFHFENAQIGTVFRYNGTLRAVVRPIAENNYSVLSILPNHDDKQFAVFSNIETVITNSAGQVIVAYNRNLMDEAHVPLMVFDEDGREVGRYEDFYALECHDVNLDAKERIWFHLYPSDTIDCFDPEDGVTERHRVALQDFEAFAFSTDLSRLFVFFPERGGGSVSYVLSRDANGDYVNPIRFEFEPRNDDGKVLEAKDCQVFGWASAMKNWVILNADGKLYLYNVDDFTAESGK